MQPSPNTISSLALMRDPGLIKHAAPNVMLPCPASRPHTPICTRWLVVLIAVKE
jgi:hypothetical protein